MNDARTSEDGAAPAGGARRAGDGPQRRGANDTVALDGAPSLVLARVVGVPERAVLLEVGGETRAARQAASCLLSPEPGDIVVCSETRLGIHVLHVLERDAAQSATLSAPGVRRLVLDQPAIDIRTVELDATATRVRARVEQLHLISRLVSAVTGRLEIVADRLRRIAGHEVTSTGDSVRTVRGTDTLRAGHILHDASQVMSLRSHVAIVEARGDVRVNGERITMG